MATPLPEIIGPGDSEKICAVCAIMKPASAFYFHKDPTTDDGWCPKCKECRKKDRQEERNKEVSVNLTRLQAQLLSRISNCEGRQSLCDLESGGEVMLEAFGGITGLAQKMAQDYEASPIGTHGRTKLLLGALQFVSKAMEQRQSIKVDTMDDETLKAALKDALGDEYQRITSQPPTPALGGPEQG
jgi:hypothetical protein